MPYPAKYVHLRGAQEEKYVVIDLARHERPGNSSNVIEEVEVSRALFELYEGGVVRIVPGLFVLTCER